MPLVFAGTGCRACSRGVSQLVVFSGLLCHGTSTLFVVPVVYLEMKLHGSRNVAQARLFPNECAARTLKQARQHPSRITTAILLPRRRRTAIQAHHEYYVGCACTTRAATGAPIRRA